MADSIAGTLKNLEMWINRAAKALMMFYDDDYGAFWRDTISKTPSKASPNSGTSTSRSFFALFEYRRFLTEENLIDTQAFRDTCKILCRAAQKNLRRLATNPDRIRRESSNGVNMFTDSHLLIAAAILPSIDRSERLRLPLVKMRSSCQKIARENLKTLAEKQGGVVNEKDVVHDFITLHSIRGLDSIGFLEVPIAIGERAKKDVLRSLGYHHSAIFSRFDPTELVFSTAVMSRFPNTESSQIFQAAVKVATESQNLDGSWPTARIVSSSGEGLLHVASYEVALTLTHLLRRKLNENEEETWQLLLDSLDRTFTLVRKSFIEQPHQSGWANDHTRAEGLIESWATAIVLTFLVHYRDMLLTIRQSSILSKYHLYQDLTLQSNLHWPDLEPALRQPVEPGRTWNARLSDPTVKGRLTHQLETHFIRPILQSDVRRPGKSRSLILYGPPGGRKTSLAKCVSCALNWPLLVLSPPDFLKMGGLEGFEAAAQSVFDDLLILRRVVVLFDECEDFFKRRQSEQQLEARTIGAFITAGMLPRMQLLWDNGWVVFIFATNSTIEDLDPAVFREGRFDFGQFMHAPGSKAQRTYLLRKAAEHYGSRRNVNMDLLKQLNKSLTEFRKLSRSKAKGGASKKRVDADVAISFNILDKLGRKFFGARSIPTIDEVVLYLGRITNIYPESLVVK